MFWEGARANVAWSRAAVHTKYCYVTQTWNFTLNFLLPLLQFCLVDQVGDYTGHLRRLHILIIAKSNQEEAGFVALSSSKGYQKSIAKQVRGYIKLLLTSRNVTKAMISFSADIGRCLFHTNRENVTRDHAVLFLSTFSHSLSVLV